MCRVSFARRDTPGLRVHTCNVKRRACFRFGTIRIEAGVQGKPHLPQTEAEICERVRRFREATGLSRVEMAAACGIDSSALANVELKRSPLSYRVAFRLLQRFPELAPPWLARGRGGMTNPLPRTSLPIPAGDHVLERATFSFVYEHVIRAVEVLATTSLVLDHEKDWPKGVKFTNDVHGRLDALRFFRDTLIRCFSLVPDEQINSAAEALLSALDRWSMGFRINPPAKASSIESELRIETERQVMLDVTRRKPTVAPVKRVPDDLASLIEIARRLTSRRGAKARLARHLGISRQAVDQWLRPEDDEGRTCPSAEKAIALLSWVLNEEASEFGRAVTPPRHKTTSGTPSRESESKPSPPVP